MMQQVLIGGWIRYGNGMEKGRGGVCFCAEEFSSYSTCGLRCTADRTPAGQWKVPYWLALWSHRWCVSVWVSWGGSWLCVCVCVCVRVVVVCVAHRPVVVVVRSATGRHESLELPVTLRFTVAHRSAAEWIVAGRLSLAPFPYLDWVAALPIRVVVYCITRFVCISPCALSFLVLTKPSND